MLVLESFSFSPVWSAEINRYIGKKESIGLYEVKKETNTLESLKVLLKSNVQY